MRPNTDHDRDYQRPLFMDEAEDLATYIKDLSVNEMADSMHLSKTMSSKAWFTWQSWNGEGEGQPAIDAFLGDIYSGLQSKVFKEKDRQYANEHLYIISGLYGILRSLDCVSPYRLELGYKLPDSPYDNLYKYWGNKIAKQLPETGYIINLTSNEYAKAVLPYVSADRVITPKFMTIDENSNKPVFVAVHAKIARGAYAGWLVKNQYSKVETLTNFAELNYEYSADLSSTLQPVYVCKTFGGLGLSVRIPASPNAY